MIRAASTAILSAIAVVITASSGSAAQPDFVITGAGWGHGVGMSQWGAYQQAVEGRTADSIIRSYYTGVEVGPMVDAAAVRVNVGYQLTTAHLRSRPLAAGGGSFAVSNASKTISASGGRVVIGTRAGVAAARVFSAGRIVGAVRGTKLTIRWEGTRPGRSLGRAATAIEISPNSAGRYRSTAYYRYGQLFVHATSSRLNVVNHLRIHDEYLPGIAEVSASWPAAALQAQAIAARSYVLSKRAIRSACNCHVDDGSGPYFDQTFHGYAREVSPLGDRWSAAVRATAVSASEGIVASFDGKAIPAFYYASSGGRTANSEDVWGGSLPWARSVADPWSLRAAANPNRSWRAVRSQAAVASAVGLVDVVRVVVLSRDASGQIRLVRATDSTGRTRDVSGGQFTSRLGLTSRWVTGIT